MEDHLRGSDQLKRKLKKEFLVQGFLALKGIMGPSPYPTVYIHQQKKKRTTKMHRIYIHTRPQPQIRNICYSKKLQSIQLCSCHLKMPLLVLKKYQTQLFISSMRFFIRRQRSRAVKSSRLGLAYKFSFTLCCKIMVFLQQPFVVKQGQKLELDCFIN